MAYVCGIEEAGRGPVIGPMVMAALWTQDEEAVRRAGAKDSKQLTPAQREGVFSRLHALKDRGEVDFEIIIILPEEIDAAVRGETDNLNLLELRTSAKLINIALARAGISRVIIDCPTRSTEKYAKAVKALVRGGSGTPDIEVIAENKADENYPIVGAASILAKVTRDAEIAKIRERIGINFGSGYPADPFTQKFLRENYKDPRYDLLFRKSWGSYKALLERERQKSLFGFNEEEETSRLASEHMAQVKEFEVLTAHGFEFSPPTNQYEVLRMKSDDATVIKYTTGKLVVQGKGKARAERILKKLNLI